MTKPIENLVNTYFEHEKYERYVKRINRHYKNLVENLTKYEKLSEIQEDRKEEEREVVLIQTQFKELTNDLGRIKDYVYDITAKHYSYVRENGETKGSEILSYEHLPSNATGFRKYIKKLESFDTSEESDFIKARIYETLECTKEMESLRLRIVDLKPKIGKKQSAQAKEQKTKQKFANHADSKAAMVHLESVVEQIKDAIIERSYTSIMNKFKMIQRDLITHGLERFEKNGKKTSLYTIYGGSELSKVANIQSSYNFQMKSKDEVEKTAKEEAEKAYQFFKQFYLTRISDKIGSILSSKNNLDTVVTNQITAKEAIVSNLTFKFKDNSQFTIDTQVEWSAMPSDSSEYFMRVPTRFQNVIDAKGRVHRGIFEEEMNTLFATGKLEEIQDSKIKPKIN